MWTGIFLVLSVLIVLGTIRWRADRAARTNLDRVGAALNLDVHPLFPHALTGRVRDVELSIRVEEWHGPGMIELRIVVGHPLSDLQIKQRDPSVAAVATGDLRFDQMVTVLGDERDILALLPSTLRADVLQAAEKNAFTLAGGEMRAWVSDHDPEYAVRRAKSLCELAEELRQLGAKNRDTLLEHNAGFDKNINVRARNLSVLLASAPQSVEAERALKHALDSDEPLLLYIAATEAGDTRLDVLADIAQMRRADPKIREDAIHELAMEAPVESLELFTRLFDSASPAVAGAALSAMNMLDFSMLPIAEMLDRLSRNEPALVPAILNVLSRVDDEGHLIEHSLRRQVLETLHQRGFFGNGERGSLSLAMAEGSGSLSMPPDPGMLAFAETPDRKDS
jgi:hypothetical protein